MPGESVNPIHERDLTKEQRRMLNVFRRSTDGSINVKSLLEWLESEGAVTRIAAGKAEFNAGRIAELTRLGPKPVVMQKRKTAKASSQKSFRGTRKSSVKVIRKPALGSVATKLSRAVAAKLGGKRVLGFQVNSEADLARMVAHRIPIKAIDELKKAGLSDSEIGDLIIPSRTLSHRRAKEEPLTVEESDRAVRVARIAALAEETFGDPGKAEIWLRKHLAALDGRTPLELARMDVGARIVENLLARIAWGVAA